MENPTAEPGGDAGVTGLSARLETPHGFRTVRSGVGDIHTGRPVPADGYLRIGSTTKTFVATVLLQLAGEGRLSLTDTVDTWLPGLVRGHGNDGRRITLRQLLRHTSGLPDYVKDVVPEPGAAGYRHHRWTAYTPEQRVALALLRHPRRTRPRLDTAVLRRRVLGARRHRVRLRDVARRDPGRADHPHRLHAQPPRGQRHGRAPDPGRHRPGRPRPVRRAGRP
ncbi:serine hydrolase domain-containing protein [Streptomyces libani]|uniref:serine hydrolase domain-containing protein n=1 Tax=Streptomyces nigrescens TaxID=1920 RepID=UPI003801E3C2